VVGALLGAVAQGLQVQASGESCVAIAVNNSAAMGASTSSRASCRLVSRFCLGTSTRTQSITRRARTVRKYASGLSMLPQAAWTTRIASAAASLASSMSLRPSFCAAPTPRGYHSL
jgi:hypothetical protein